MSAASVHTGSATAAASAAATTVNTTPQQQQPIIQQLVSTPQESLKHCECRNAKELIQLIRSDAIEFIEASWPDDMGLWYSTSIRSHEVSLQNLVEGIRFYDQVLMVDSSSARFDLTKKNKTILVRCSSVQRMSLTTDNNSSVSASSRSSRSKQPNNCNNNNNATQQQRHHNHPSSASSPPSMFSSDDDGGADFDESSNDESVIGDCEVYHSPSMPTNKLSYLIDESERERTSKRHPSRKSPRAPHASLNDSSDSILTDSSPPDSPSTNPPSSPPLLGKRKDADWLECPKNRVELVPDLSNPTLIALERVPDGMASPGRVPNSELSSIDNTERLIIEGQIQLPPLLRPRQYHACKISKEERSSKRRKSHTTLFCRHCGTNDTPEWRRGPDGRKSLCNACGLHYSKTIKREHQNQIDQTRTFDITNLLNPAAEC
ncbi:hypothetical protein SAMD00019534_107610 [Acytostelium subglobosum LB1]|uniref:hypothetical protein n=1 Tax=Acytostelium subglobosum LB1 TaxID=1410327 RepID=UPI000644E255|nr:hypothetical protein SAMD00019534_107610 [Acytostelium subglobosum LB1]GAM27585.1 hypothetical protein SAMD00019534_107610 [Acytostelium subglobosum LB1]|eukprot:XP_012749650.1 hypothetical protein SAMD00019534_107610 [Acytostelium subglobosum LB1]